MSVVGDNSLRPPVVPKVADIDTQRAIATLQDKLVEAQAIIRALVDAVRALGGNI